MEIKDANGNLRDANAGTQRPSNFVTRKEVIAIAHEQATAVFHELNKNKPSIFSRLISKIIK